MSETIHLPITTIKNKKWIILQPLSDSFLIRAVSIGKKKKVSDPSDHGRYEIPVNGGVKLHAKKEWDLTEFIKKKGKATS